MEGSILEDTSTSFIAEDEEGKTVLGAGKGAAGAEEGDDGDADESGLEGASSKMMARSEEETGKAVEARRHCL